MLDLGERDKILLCSILNKFLNGRDVRAFGSRVNGNAKPYSDLDLVVMGENHLPVKILGDIKEAFEESDLPFQVDILEWSITSEEFRTIILRSSVPLDFE